MWALTVILETSMDIWGPLGLPIPSMGSPNFKALWFCPSRLSAAT